MPRIFCAFGVALLVAAFVLQFLFQSGHVSLTEVSDPISQLRLGIWGHCEEVAKTGSTTCQHTGHAYSIDIHGPRENQVVVIQSSWTNGLAVHPVAAVIAFVALLLSFSTHLTVRLISSLTSFLAALLTLVAYAIDIALFVLTKNAISNLNPHSTLPFRTSTDPGPGFWLTLASFILLLLAGCTVCFGRRRDRDSYNGPIEYPDKRPFWRRWHR